jgi:hypothetical protein
VTKQVVISTKGRADATTGDLTGWSAQALLNAYTQLTHAIRSSTTIPRRDARRAERNLVKAEILRRMEPTS